MLPYEKITMVEYINTFEIHRGKVGNDNNINEDKKIEKKNVENGFNIDDLEIEKFQMTIYKTKNCN